MAGYTRPGDRERAGDRRGVAVTDPTSLDTEADIAGRRFAQRLCREFKPSRRGRLDCAVAELSKQLGAHHYIDGKAADPGEVLKELGGATLIVNTASTSSAAAPALAGMKAGGTLIALGVGDDNIEVSATDLIFRNVTASGSLTGLPATADATLKFSVLTSVAPMIETMPLERAPEAYDRMMKGDARFRIVLTTGQ